MPGTHLELERTRRRAHWLPLPVGLAAACARVQQQMQAWRAPPIRTTTDQDDPQRWRMALEASGQGLWDWDLETDRVYYSPQWAHMIGHIPEDIEPLPAARLDRLHPDDRDGALAALDRHLRGESAQYSSEHRLRCKQGGLIWVQDRGRVVARDPTGRPTRLISVQQDITPHREANEQMIQLAYADPLTQLPNRRLLLDRLEHALATSERMGNHGALVFLDLDHFKILNDTFGHAVGDQLLQHVAQRLRSCVREADTPARMGGDEFVVMLEGLDADAATARRMAGEIGSHLLEVMSRPYTLDGYDYVVTPSIGVSLFRGRQLTGDELIHQADMAMYQVKKGGRHGLRLFESAN